VEEIILNSSFFAWFGDQPGREKITIGTDRKGHHYTMMYNGREKTINFHKTFELANGKKDYEPICEISWFSFLRIIAAVNQSTIELLKKFWIGNRINLGKLHRHDMIAFPFSGSELRTEDLFDITRKRKILLKKNIAIKPFFDDSLYPEELLGSEHPGFLIYSTKRNHLKFQGFIFKAQGDPRARSFYFVSKHSFSKYRAELSFGLRNTLSKINFRGKEKVLEYLAL
jgi:hypothetical protein